VKTFVTLVDKELILRYLEYIVITDKDKAVPA
jgi:hypothetical protein